MRILQNVVILSVTGTLVSAPLLPLKNILLKRYGGRWFYLLWLFAASTFVVPFGYVCRYWKVPAAAVNRLPETGTLFGAAPVKALTQVLWEAIYGISNRPAFMTLWLAGFVFTLAYHFMASLCLRRKIIRNGYIAGDKAREPLWNGLNKLNISADIELRVCAGMSAPFIAGLIKPVIVLPEALVRVPAIDLELVVLHELTHYKNRDILLKHLMLIVKAVHWFNPLLHFITKTVNECCEYACDYSVLRETGKEDKAFARRYADMILDAMRVSLSSLASASYLSAGLLKKDKNIKRRLELIMSNNRRTKIGATLCAVAVILGISLYIASESGITQRNMPVTSDGPAELLAAGDNTMDKGAELDISASEVVTTGTDTQKSEDMEIRIVEQERVKRTEGTPVMVTLKKAGEDENGNTLYTVYSGVYGEDGTIKFDEASQNAMADSGVGGITFKAVMLEQTEE